MHPTPPPTHTHALASTHTLTHTHITKDYLRKVVLAGRTSFATPVSAVMTPAAAVKMLTPADSVLRAMELMVTHEIRNVPVVRVAASGRGSAWWAHGVPGSPAWARRSGA